MLSASCVTSWVHASCVTTCVNCSIWLYSVMCHHVGSCVISWVHVSPPVLTAVYGFIASCVSTWVHSGMCHHLGLQCYMSPYGFNVITGVQSAMSHYLGSLCHHCHVSPPGFTVVCVTIWVQCVITWVITWW